MKLIFQQIYFLSLGRTYTDIVSQIDRRTYYSTNRQTDKQTNRQTEKQTNRQTDTQTNRQTDKQTNRQADSTHRHGQKERVETERLPGIKLIIARPRVRQRMKI